MIHARLRRFFPAIPFCFGLFTPLIAPLTAPLMVPMSASAAFEYPGCAALAPTDFKLEALAVNAVDPRMEEPLKLAFDMDALGNVDVYFVQRAGGFFRYEAAKKTVTQLADFKAFYPKFSYDASGGSDGLVGIAMDPGFKTNRWIYFFICDSANFRVSRFTLNGTALDKASEKNLLAFTNKFKSPHTGGAMQFDAKGDLWITTSENDQGWPAANTNDLRGKILRIHPTPEGGYTVPAGNLFPAGTEKTRPEIYIMGNRNPYTLSLDPVRHGIAWGDVGPDSSGGITEEHDFATKPGNHGWPMWAGNQIAQKRAAGAGTVDKPMNIDVANTGLKDLPPAIPGFDNYRRSCSITGPIYYFDKNNPSKVKMPPYFDGVWFVSDFSHWTAEALTLDAAGTAITARQTLFADMKDIDRVLDWQVGPDGAFYLANYAGYRSVSKITGIYRIVYKGDCVTGVARPGPVSRAAAPSLRMEGSVLAVASAGAHKVVIRDISGRVLARFHGTGAEHYDLASLATTGVYLVEAESDQGMASGKILR